MKKVLQFDPSLSDISKLVGTKAEGIVAWNIRLLTKRAKGERCQRGVGGPRNEYPKDHINNMTFDAPKVSSQQMCTTEVSSSGGN